MGNNGELSFEGNMAVPGRVEYKFNNPTLVIGLEPGGNPKGKKKNTYRGQDK